MAEGTPVSCFTTSKEGLTVAPNECGCDGGVKGPQPIVLARDACGTFENEKMPSVKVMIGPSFCCEDAFCSCCFCGPIPVCPGMWFRDFNCSAGCKSTNAFQNQGHYYTFHDKDTFVYHYLCCPTDKFVRVRSSTATAA